MSYIGLQPTNVTFSGAYIINGSYTVAPEDREKVLLADASAGAIVVTLPAASVVGNGFFITVKKVDSSANGVLLSPTGSSTIDGSTGRSLTFQNDAVRLKTNGINWFIESEAGSVSTGAYVRKTGDVMSGALTAVVTDTNNNGSTSSLRATHLLGNTPSVGIGAGIDFEAQTAPATSKIGGVISAIANSITAGAENFRLSFRTMKSGAAATESMAIGNGVMVGAPTGGDMGAGTVNATSYFVNGAPLVLQDVIVAVSSAQNANMSTSTAIIPVDDTIPQLTEGSQILTVTHTPKSATNRLQIDVVAHIANGGNGRAVTIALFRNTEANAIAAASNSYPGNNTMLSNELSHLVAAGTVSPITFSVRAGVSAGDTLTVNGASGARRFGGVLISSITVTEIKA